MSVDLGTYEESLQREVTPVGGTVPAGVDWTSYLVDAFWEARLDGFLEGYAASEDGVVTPTVGVDDLPRQYVALVVLYAGIRMLRNQILNMNTAFRAKAGPVEFEQQNSATMLVEMLKQLQATKNRLLYQSTQYEIFDSMLDAFSTRLFSPGAYFGSLEVAGAEIPTGPAVPLMS